MNPNPRDPATRAAVRAIWDKVPALKCKGLCSEFCGPIMMTAVEFDMVKRAGGDYAPAAGCKACPKLTAGRCSVYDVRPLICRLWGTVDSPEMRCPHGCEPERYLSDEEGKALLFQMEQAGGLIPPAVFRAVAQQLKKDDGT